MRFIMFTFIFTLICFGFGIFVWYGSTACWFKLILPGYWRYGLHYPCLLYSGHSAFFKGLAMQTLLFVNRWFWELQAKTTRGQGHGGTGTYRCWYRRPSLAVTWHLRCYKKADACGPPILIMGLTNLGWGAPGPFLGQIRTALVM